jgi:Flp pilus assembly protein TadB
MSNPPDPLPERDSLIPRPASGQESLTTATPTESYFNRWRRQARSDFLDTLRKEATMSGITGILVILITITLFLLGVAPLVSLLPVAAFIMVVLTYYTFHFIHAPATLDRNRQSEIDSFNTDIKELHTYTGALESQLNIQASNHLKDIQQLTKKK